MDVTQKKEAIKNKFNKLTPNLKEQLKFEEDFTLDNGKKADLALIDSITNKPHSLWKIEDEIENSKDDRVYFHQKDNPFMGCGVDSKFWIYSDGDKFVLNDQSYNYPFDEHYKTVNGLFKRMEKSREYWEKEI
jgi:hypothetical protein